MVQLTAHGALRIRTAARTAQIQVVGTKTESPKLMEELMWRMATKVVETTRIHRACRQWLQTLVLVLTETKLTSITVPKEVFKAVKVKPVSIKAVKIKVVSIKEVSIKAAITTALIFKVVIWVALVGTRNLTGTITGMNTITIKTTILESMSILVGEEAIIGQIDGAANTNGG